MQKTKGKRSVWHLCSFKVGHDTSHAATTPRKQGNTSIPEPPFFPQLSVQNVPKHLPQTDTGCINGPSLAKSEVQPLEISSNHSTQGESVEQRWHVCGIPWWLIPKVQRPGSLRLSVSGFCVWSEGRRFKFQGWQSDVIVGPLSKVRNPNCFKHCLTLPS